MRAKLIRTEPLGASVTTFYFQPERPVYYLAGQWTELGVPHQPSDERGASRQFTVSSSPTEPELAVTVSFAGSRSTYKQALRQLPLGSDVRFDEPMGDFVLPLNPATPLVWIAGGIGITPFRSMAKYLSDSRETREIILFHSVADTSDAFFDDVFQMTGINRRIINTAAADRLDTEDILQNMQSAIGTQFYIAGPEPMAQCLQSGLIAFGVPSSDIILDAFLGYA